MAEEPENSFCVSVMHMVDPATFWVAEPLGENMSLARQELQNLEERLAGHFRRSYNTHRGSYLPEEEELVAVQHPDTGCWHRGEITCTLHYRKGYMYDVFLVDHGQSLKVRSSAIRELPGICKDLDYQAFHLLLYGVMPTTIDMDYKEMKMKRELSNCWTAAAIRFVKNLLEESLCCWVTCQNVTERKICGDLHLKLPTGIISLTEELCKEEYALQSEEHFETALAISGTKSLFRKCTSPQSHTSPQSPPGSLYGSSRSTSPPPAGNNKTESTEYRNIKEYVRVHNELKARRENETVKRIENWRKNITVSSTDTDDGRDSFEDESDDEVPLGRGRGIPLHRRRRKEVAPGMALQSSQPKLEDSLNASSSSETQSLDEAKLSSMLGLLDLLNHKSKNTPPTSNKIPCDNMNTSPIPMTFIPAGGSLVDNCKPKSKNKAIKPKENGKLTHNGSLKYGTSNKQTESPTLDTPTSSNLNTLTKKVHSSVVTNSESGTAYKQTKSPVLDTPTSSNVNTWTKKVHNSGVTHSESGISNKQTKSPVLDTPSSNVNTWMKKVHNSGVTHSESETSNKQTKIPFDNNPTSSNMVHNSGMTHSESGISNKQTKSPVLDTSMSNKVHNPEVTHSESETSNKQTKSPVLDPPTSSNLNTWTKLHSTVMTRSESSDKVKVVPKPKQRSQSLLQFIRERRARTSESDSSKVQTNVSVQNSIASEEKTSSINSLQDIVNSMVKSDQSKRQVLLDDIEKTSLPSKTLPDMKTRLPQAALKALLKRESLENKVEKSSSANSAAGSIPANVPRLSAEDKIPDQIQASRILVHGSMGTRPIQSIAEATFPKEIHQALRKMNFKTPMRIQKYAWPAIMRGHYTVLVGPSECGKTLAYIVPLMSFMFTPDIYSELQEGNGPLVLVLCSNSKSAHFVYETCQKLANLSNCPDVQIQIAYGGGREQELRDPLANGCQILISTPRCFLRLLKCSNLITNMDRLAHFVLDEVDIMAHKFLPELKELLTECKKMLMRRAKAAVPVQLIAVSEKWCPSVDQFSQNISQNFLVCISGYLEAAVYAKLHPKLHLLSAADKPRVTLDILDGHQGLYKTMIICQTPEQVDELVPFLKSQCYQVLSAHEKMSIYNNSEVRHRWKSSIIPGAYPVLVCTDEVLPELDIYDALWLINYGLPQTKTGFGYRFSCLMNNYTNMFEAKPENADAPECRVHIFVDRDQNTRELPEIVQFLKRLSVPIAPDIEARTVKIMHQKECRKVNASLCYFVKAFGECLKKTSCPNRHIIMNSMDKSTNIPTCGEVKVKIIYVHNASHFSVRILEHIDANGNNTVIPDEYFSICMAVYKHYSDETNRQLHGIPKLGDVCALESKMNIFQRVEVTEIVKEDSRGIPAEVKVKFLDEGHYTTVKVFQLLVLPEELQRLQPQVVDTFLCNVMPCDLDTNWSETANLRMAGWINKISKQEAEGKYLVGKIMLSAKNTLWLDPLEYRSYLSSVDTHVMELSLSKELLRCKLAVSNPSHVTKLYELCRVDNFDVPNYEKVPVVKTRTKIPALPTPQWAYLDKDAYQKVDFVVADSPDCFFVRQDKFYDSFQKLVNELQKCDKSKPKDFCLEKGVCCLAKFPDDGKWYRAQVLQMLEGDHVSLFFVDHGDCASVCMDDIAPITEKFITKLPFQAIECSLVGIAPIENDIWEEEAIDLLYDFTDSITTYAKVCDSQSARHTGGKLYKVVLIDTNTSVDVVLNKLMLEKNLAREVESEQYWKSLSLVEAKEQIKEENEDDDDDGDDEDDDCKHSDAESDAQIVKLSDLDNLQSSPVAEMEDSGLNSFEDEGFDFQIDNVGEFLTEMMGLNKKKNEALPAIEPPPDDQNSNYSNYEDTLTDVESDETDHDEYCIPPLIRKTRTPLVLWFQDVCRVDVRIKLPGVEQYYLVWDVTHLQFSTKMVDDVIYEVSLDLFGPIDVWTLRHQAKGFFVEIKMEKIGADFQWPRLIRSQYKCPWLKKDIERFGGEDDSEEEGTSKCNKALLVDSSGDSDDYDDDSGSDVPELPDGPYDPYDPLN